MQVGYRHKSRFWCNNWLSKIACWTCELPKTFTEDEAVYMTQSAMHHWLSMNCWTCELQSDKNSCRGPCSVGLDRTVGDAPANVCLSRPAAWADTPEKRTENNLIVRSGISEAETTVLIIQEAQLSQRGRAMLRVCL